MTKLIFSKTAKDDLNKMFRYGFTHWGEAQATRFLDNFIDDLSIITMHPEIGKATDTGRFRSFTFGQYQVVYSILEQGIYIRSVDPKGR